jgi:glycogen debranching enzyme
MPEHALPATAAPDKFHIAATAPVMERARVLKAGDTFGLFDVKGDICALQHGPEGLFHEDTRFLSEFRMRIAGGELLLLASTVTEDATLSVDLTNPDIRKGASLALPRELLHVLRTKQLGPGHCHERLRFQNYGDRPLLLPLSFSFSADFRDIFEVRGMYRPRRGERHKGRLLDDGVMMAYSGLDGERRETRLRFDPPPHALVEGAAGFELMLEPGEAWTLEIGIRCRNGQRAVARPAPRRDVARLASSNALFDEWVERSRSDLDMLTTDTPYGPYAYAGIPWFSTAFGRDGIIAALQTLWLDPGLGRGVLQFLAATQATVIDAANDAQPGKILHEIRKGEMATLREVPFGRYYGSIDATPLFVMLAGAYWERTGDVETIRRLWPNIIAALDWVERWGDLDGDGFLEYVRASPDGLVNQGWKDSNDSVFHADGRLAAPPIALSEVQAYAYAARLAAVRLARAVGMTDLANHFFGAAMDLREHFERAFWCEELDTYALALDGAKQPCRVKSSNAGHALFCSIAAAERAGRLAERLMEDAAYSGWGIRTIACGAARYNPMSYHNGSIWPHDNALIGMGFAHYDLKEPLLRLLGGLFEAAIAMDLRRLPELFCGFPRRPSVGPTSYPVACSPQAWSSAAVFGLVGACLGVSYAPDLQQIRFRRPVLPSFLDELRVDGLRLGAAEVDILFRRHVNDVAVNVVRRSGAVEVIVTS